MARRQKKSKPKTEPGPRSRRVRVDVLITHKAWEKDIPGLARKTKQWIKAAYRAAKMPVDAELSVLFANDAMVRRLNREFRGKDKPTNVLSFSNFDAKTLRRLLRQKIKGMLPLGDIVLSHQTMKREAKDQGKTLSDHTAHLAIHGALHLLDYKHDSKREEKRMERLETKILQGFRIADPYRDLC